MGKEENSFRFVEIKKKTPKIGIGIDNKTW